MAGRLAFDEQQGVAGKRRTAASASTSARLFISSPANRGTRMTTGMSRSSSPTRRARRSEPIRSSMRLGRLAPVVMAAGVPVSPGSCLFETAARTGRKSKPVEWNSREREAGAGRVCHWRAASRRQRRSAPLRSAHTGSAASAGTTVGARADQGPPEADGEGGEREDQSAPETTSERQGRPWDQRCQEPCDRSGGHEQIARDDRAGRVKRPAGAPERRPGHHGEAHGADRAHREAVQGIARRQPIRSGRPGLSRRARPGAAHA